MSRFILLFLSLLILVVVETRAPPFFASGGSDIHAKLFNDAHYQLNGYEKKPGFDSAKSVAEEFLTTFQHNLDYRYRTTALSDSFENKFYLTGCQRDYNKEELLDYLYSIPLRREPVVFFKSANSVTGKEIQMTVVFRVFDSSDLGLVLNLRQVNETYVAVSGAITTCQEIADSIAGDFRKTFQHLLDYRYYSAANLSRTFSDSFHLIGCQKDYDKEGLLNYLHSIPARREPVVFYKSANFVAGKDIQINVVFRVFESTDLGLAFILRQNNGTYVLVSGATTTCGEIAVSIAENFLNTFQRDLDYRTSNLSNSFQSTFHLKGCQRDYDKEQILDFLYSIPAQEEPVVVFKSANFSTGKDIQMNIVFRVLERPDHGVTLILRKENNQYILTNGTVTKCEEAAGYPIVTSFLDSFNTACKQKGQDKFAKLLSQSFVIKFCSSKLSADDLLKISRSIPIELSFLSVDFFNKKVLTFTVVANIGGNVDTRWQVELHQEKGNYVLAELNALNCPKN